MEPRFERYCRNWSADIATISDDGLRMAYFEEQLPKLLLDRDTIRSILTHMTGGHPWPDLKEVSLFSHEILLYLDPGRRFSIRLYFHPPKQYTPIHDHTAWGVSGTPLGRLSVIAYEYGGEIESGRVQLGQRYHKLLLPGEVGRTLPWMEGIHQTGSVDDELNVMISAYGRPGRRLYVNCFDAETGQVERRYPPKMMRRRLAEEALRTF